MGTVQQIEIHQTLQCSAQRSLVIKRKIIGHPWQHGKGAGETVPVDTRAPKGGGVEDMGDIVQLTQPRAAGWVCPETGLACLIPVLTKPLHSPPGWITGKDRAGYRPYRSTDDPVRLYTVDQHLLVDAGVEGSERIAAAQNKSHVRAGTINPGGRCGGHDVPCCTGVETRRGAGKFLHREAGRRPCPLNRPRPGEPDCRVPPALLPESRTRRENAYLLWRSTVRVSTDDDGESKIARKPRSRRRNDVEQPAPAHPRTRRSKSPVPALEPGGSPD